MNEKKPLKDFKAKGIKLTIWEHVDKGWCTTKITKSYIDKKEGGWVETNNYFKSELYALRDLISEALVYVEGKEKEMKSMPMDRYRFDPNDDIPL